MPSDSISPLHTPSFSEDILDLPVNLPQSSLPARSAPPVRYDEEPYQGSSLMNISVVDQDADNGFLLDSSRLFYHDGGAFKHDWSVYRINLVAPSVTVFWTSELSVDLTGQAAVQFLRITKSRFMRAFAEAAGVDLHARSVPKRTTGMRSSRPDRR